MNQAEHRQEARELLRKVHEEATDGGNERIAAELLWGAIAHCLIAVAQDDGLPHNSHRAFERTAQHMGAVQVRNDLRSRFGSAERLHRHFYHGDLQPQEFRTHRRLTRDGVQELLETLENSN